MVVIMLAVNQTTVGVPLSNKVPGKQFSGTRARSCCTELRRQKVSVSRSLKRNSSHGLVTYASYSANNYGPMGGDARIKVIGVGGGGGNAVNRMISSGLQVCDRCQADMTSIASLRLRGGRILGGACVTRHLVVVSFIQYLFNRLYIII